MQKQQYLWERVNYHSQIPYIFNNFIREYDIQKANISILYSKGLISEKLYNRLLVAPREVRQVEIGMLQKDEKIDKALKQGIVEAKKQLFEANNIQDHEILCIKNDAVFIIGRALQYTDFGFIKFIEKHVYTSYMLFTGLGNNVECFYHYDRINKIEQYVVKGLGDSYKIHEEYLSDFIKYIFYEVESGRVESALGAIITFNMDYVSLELDSGYYREFNSYSMFSIKNSEYKIWAVLDDKESKKMIDINYNLNIIRMMFQYISNIYFQSRR